MSTGAPVSGPSESGEQLRETPEPIDAEDLGISMEHISKQKRPEVARLIAAYDAARQQFFTPYRLSRVQAGLPRLHSEQLETIELESRFPPIFEARKQTFITVLNNLEIPALPSIETSSDANIDPQIEEIENSVYAVTEELYSIAERTAEAMEAGKQNGLTMSDYKTVREKLLVKISTAVQNGKRIAPLISNWASIENHLVELSETCYMMLGIDQKMDYTYKKNNAGSQDVLTKPVRALLGTTLAVGTIMAGLTLWSKKKSNQQISALDIIQAGLYTWGASTLLGIPGKFSRSELERLARTMDNLGATPTAPADAAAALAERQNEEAMPPFRRALKRIGLRKVLKELQSFAYLLEEKTVRSAIEQAITNNALSMEEITKIANEAGDTAVLPLLKQTDVTDEDRAVFIRKMISEKIWDDKNFDRVHATLLAIQSAQLIADS